MNNSGPPPRRRRRVPRLVWRGQTRPASSPVHGEVRRAVAQTVLAGGDRKADASLHPALAAPVIASVVGVGVACRCYRSDANVLVGLDGGRRVAGWWPLLAGLVLLASAVVGRAWPLVFAASCVGLGSLAVPAFARVHRLCFTTGKGVPGASGPTRSG